MKPDNLKFIEADKSHIASLKEIWKISFGDEDEYIDFFFENRFNTCKTIVVLNNGKPIGAMYLMNVSTIEYGKIKEGFYGYAIALIPDFRGNGIYKIINKEIQKILFSKNKFYILSPANEKLCEYYKSLGFIENAYVSEEIFIPDTSNRDYECTDLTNEDFIRLRNSNFRNLIRWDKAGMDYILNENKFLKGINLLINVNQNQYYIIARFVDNVLIVIESNAITKDLKQDISNFLCKKYSCNKVQWTGPAEKNRKDKVLYGLSWNLKSDNYYLNHILN